MYLSIIVPFFNSEKKSKRLLNTLHNIKDKEIEIILVDDGSTDNTYSIISSFKKENSDKKVIVIKQSNKGPGGARNTGVKAAEGRYIWFVDSDDDITLEGLAFIRENYKRGFDFIDFNFESTRNYTDSMSLLPGEYVGKEKCQTILLNNFGHLWTKVIKRKIIIDNEVFYPEFCIYEDNPLVFIYPHFISSFLKTDIIAYIHHEEYESVTRSKPGARFLDRLHTAAYGFKKGSQLTDNQDYMNIMKQHFIRLYFTNTVGSLVTVYPSYNWLVMLRVMKHYRKVSKDLGIDNNPFETVKGSIKYRAYLKANWVLSYLILKDQTGFFDTKRKEAWGDNA